MSPLNIKMSSNFKKKSYKQNDRQNFPYVEPSRLTTGGLKSVLHKHTSGIFNI